MTHPTVNVSTNAPLSLADAFALMVRNVNANARLITRGRLVNDTIIIRVGDASWRLQFAAGRIASAEPGPFVMPSTSFRLAASEAEWQLFWRPVPPPGSHDLFAMLKRRVLQLDGNLHPFMANLLYFKQVLAAPRERL